MKLTVKGCADCPFKAFVDRGWSGELDVCSAANDRDLMLPRGRLEPTYAPDWCPANGEGVTVARAKPSALSKIVKGYVSRAAFDPRPRAEEHPDPGADEDDDSWVDFFRDLPT